MQSNPFPVPPSTADVRAVCGSRFNTFGPAKADADQPCDFFRPKVGATDRRRWAADDEVARFDWLT